MGDGAACVVVEVGAEDAEVAEVVDVDADVVAAESSADVWLDAELELALDDDVWAACSSSRVVDWLEAVDRSGEGVVGAESDDGTVRTIGSSEAPVHAAR